MGFAGMQSAEYAQQLLNSGKPQQINLLPIGTGPYRFKSYAKDSTVRYEANPQYWGAPQKTRSLIFAIVTDPQVRIQKLKANECQVAAAVREADLDSERRQEHPDRLHRRQQYLLPGLQPETAAIRQARSEGGAGHRHQPRRPVQGAIPQGRRHPGGQPLSAVHLELEPQDPQRIQPGQGQGAAGPGRLPQGFTVNLWALPVQRPTNPNGKLMAQMIQQDWARIGVKANIQSYEWGEYLKRAAAGEHDVYMSGLTSNSGDPDDFLWNTLSCSVSKGGQRFCNPEFDKLLQLGRQTSEQSRRAQYYLQAQEIFSANGHGSPWPIPAFTFRCATMCRVS